MDFSQFCCLKGKNCVGGYCSPGAVGFLVFWNDQMEPNESKGPLCAKTANHKLKVVHKQGCRNSVKAENREFVILQGRVWHCPVASSFTRSDRHYV